MTKRGSGTFNLTRDNLTLSSSQKQKEEILKTTTTTSATYLFMSIQIMCDTHSDTLGDDFNKISRDCVNFFYF